MKHAGKLRMTLLTCAAAALVLGSSVGTSMSYFTTYVRAEGSKTAEVKRTLPYVDEKLEGSIKQVTIRNNGDRDCYVRVKVFAPVDCEIAGTNWTQIDGYWYYSEVLKPDEEAALLTVTPDPADRAEDYEIIVVAESAPVVYETATDGNGETTSYLAPNTPEYKGWSLKKAEHSEPEQPEP